MPTKYTKYWSTKYRTDLLSKEDNAAWNINQRFNQRMNHRIAMTEKQERESKLRRDKYDAEMAAYEARPRFELIKALVNAKQNRAPR